MMMMKTTKKMIRLYPLHLLLAETDAKIARTTFASMELVERDHTSWFLPETPPSVSCDESLVIA